MKKFIEEYGFGILTAIVVIVLLCLATPVGDTIGNSLKGIVQNLSKQTTNLAKDAWDSIENVKVDEKIYWEVKDKVLYLSAKEKLSDSFDPREKYYSESEEKSTQPWKDYSITKVKILDRIVPENTSGWFSGFANMETFEGLDLINTKYVTDMSYMFYNTARMGSFIPFVLDLSSWDVSNVTNMSNMFAYSGQNSSKSWTIGDISNWNVSKVTNMSAMFKEAGFMSPTFEINLSNWDVSNVTDMSEMFYNTGRNSTTLWTIGDISNWNVSKVTNMSAMFRNANYRATSLSLDLSSWNTSNVTDMSYMFYSFVYSATSSNLDLSSWNTSNVTDMSYMFNNFAYKAKSFSLDLSHLNASNAKVSNMFNNAGKSATTWTVKIPEKTGDLTNKTTVLYGKSSSINTAPCSGKEFTLVN